jgi:transcription antitermination factor NusG
MNSSDYEMRKQWFALYTAANNEKRVEQHLRRRAVETFLPLYSVTKRWKNRTTATVNLPLFAGYVFARFARAEGVRMLEIPMVYSIVSNKQGALVIPDHEIDALRQVLVGNTTEPHAQLTVGSRARIHTGALAGWEGVISRTDAGLRVVLTIQSIMRSFAVHVNAEDIDLIEPDALTAGIGAAKNQVSGVVGS